MVRTVGEDESEQRVIDDIATHGWHCVHIMGEPSHPQYSFTIGLYETYGYPELIVCGLSSDVAHEIFSIMARAASQGKPIDLSAPTDELLEDYSCCFAEVPLAQYREYVGYCCWYYRGNDFPLYQIVWPSRSGHFPWQPEASAEFKSAQPFIGRTADDT